MNKPQSLFFSFILAAATASCASQPAVPEGPVELDGSVYKLIAAGGSLDGRSVEFMQRGDTVRGCLLGLGARLRDVVGIEAGISVFSLEKVNENEYTGVYRAITPGGAINDKPVTVFFGGGTMTWNLESATWERQSETKQLNEDAVARCSQ